MWDKVEGWRDSVATLAGVAHQHPQTTYAVLQKSLQQELASLQHVTPDIGTVFQDIEDVLQEIFLPALFQGGTSQIPGRAITRLPVKQAGMGLPCLTRSTGENWTSSCMIKGHLVLALHRMDEFRSGDHSLLMGKGREEIRRQHA